MNAYIVIAILIFMIISFVLNRIPYGLTAMIACVLLVLTGVATVPQAFAGFANQNLIIMAGAFLVSAAFSKTSFVSVVRNRIMGIQGGKSDATIVILMIVLTLFFAQLMPTPACMAVMMLFLGILGEDSNVSSSRMLLPVAALCGVYTAQVPVSMGTVNHIRIHGLSEAYGVYFEMLDYLKVSAVGLVVVSIFTFFAYRLLPKHAVDTSRLAEVKDQGGQLKPGQEYLTYAVFIICTLAMFFAQQLGSATYVIHVAGGLILVLAGVLSPQEATRTVSSDILFMLAGVFALSNIISESGAGEIIGTAITRMMGGHPSGLMLTVVFAVLAVIITNLMSNMTTFNVLIPLALSTGIAAGVDPRAAVLSIAVLSQCACILPTANAAAGMAFAAGKYKISSACKYTVPFTILYTVCVVISSMMLYPC